MILAIDPGLSGGLAFVPRGTRTLIHAQNMPLKDGQIDGYAIAQLILEYAPTTAVIEAVASRPRQAGQFNFGFGTGVIHGACMACSVPIRTIAPAKWKAAYGMKRQADQTYKDAKNESRALATKLFPDQAQLFKRAKDDGVAEAALIALYIANASYPAL